MAARRSRRPSSTVSSGRCARAGRRGTCAQSGERGSCESAPARNRTWNLRIKSPLLCQLSYKGAAEIVAAGLLLLVLRFGRLGGGRRRRRDRRLARVRGRLEGLRLRGFELPLEGLAHVGLGQLER